MTASKTILVADDTAFVRDRFATALLGAGHTSVGVKSGAELLARLRTDLSRIDLIVLDLRLPQAGGVEMVRSIRQLDGGRIPVLVFSGTIASPRRSARWRSWGCPATSTSTARSTTPSVAGTAPLPRTSTACSPRVVLSIPVAYRSGDTIATAVTLT